MARSVHGRVICAVVACALALAATTASPRAQEEPRVRVRVSDQMTKRGVALARVVISGPTQRVAFTDETGTATFDDVLPGLYRLSVAKAAYRFMTSRFQLPAGERVTVDAALASTALPKVIGTVSVRNAPSAGVADYGANGAIRRTNETLPDALRFDPNALVGPDGSISIDGQPASATSFTLDGIPLGGGGPAGIDPRRIDADLFASVGISQDPANGGTAGSVDLRSFEPTIGLQGSLGGRFATNQDSALNGLLTGSLGNVGFVVSTAARGINGPLAGQRFFDASGLDYVHGDAGFSRGLLVKLRDGVSSTQNVSLTALRSDSRDDATCSDFGALIPCGYGPGTGTTSSLAALGGTYAVTAGRVSALFTPYLRTQRYNLDFGARYVAGRQSPAGATLASSAAGARLALTVEGSRATQYQLGAQVLANRLRTASFDGTATASQSLAQSYADFVAGARIRMSPSFAISSALRAIHADAHVEVTPEISATWTPARADAVGLAYVPHRRGISASFATALSSPQSLEFDCAAHTALASGGGDGSSDPTTSQLRLSWSHRARSFRTVVSAFRTRQADVLVPGWVDAAGLPAGQVPAGYLDAASALYRSPLGCGTAGPLSLSDIVIRRPVRLPSETTQGVSAVASINVGRSLVLVPSYTATYARADALDARFLAPRSVMFPGRQLPGIPMHRWSLVADYRAPHGGLEWIATLQHVGENNPSGLPAYTLVGGGVTFPLARGTLIVSGFNVTDRFAGAFASPAREVPLATNAGDPVGVLARPLPGRRLTVAYTVPFGARAVSRPQLTTTGLPEEAQRNTVQRYDIRGLPGTPPTDPLRADPGAASCVPEALRDAERVLAPLRGYVAQLDAARTARSVPPPRIDGVGIELVPAGDSYELRLTMNRPTTLGVARCGRFALADRDAVARYGFAERAPLEDWQLDFRYRPRFGMVLVQRPTMVVARGSRPALPTTAPSDPFAPVSDARCTAADRAAVKALLDQLRPVLTSGAAASPGDAFTVTAHGTGTGRWYAVRLTDPLLFAPFFSCAPLAATTHDELRRRGIDGDPQPAVNFSPLYGWYIVR